MITAAKIQIPNNKPNLVIVHQQSNTPFYYVEEAEIDGSKVSVSYFNENDPASEIESKDIPTKDLIEFTNEFYRDYTDKEFCGVHVQNRLPKAGLEYLTDNLKAVVTDYINQL